MSARKLLCLAYFGMNYHSGQWSRGYKLMCRAQKLLRRKGLSTQLSISCDHPQSIENDKFYQRLVENYGEKV